MNRSPRVLFSLFLALACGCSERIGSSEPQFRRPTDTRPAQRVKVATARTGQFGGLSGIAGLTSAFRATNVSAQVSGQVLQRHVEPGDRVQAGAPLVTLDETQHAIAVDEANATLEAREVDLTEAERDFQRNKELFEKGTISDGKHDAARFQRDRARSARDLTKASLRRARRALSDAIVTAPFSGTVERIDVQIGDFLQPGSPVAVVADFERVRVVAGVTAREAANISEGDTAQVWIEELGGGKLSAPIHSVGLMADVASGTYPVEIWLDNESHLIRAGMIAELQLTSAKGSSGTVVPRSAILRRNGVLSVYVALGDEGQLHAFPRDVRIGHQQDGWVELLEGIEPGERVVVEGLFALTDGTAIFIDQSEEASEGQWND